MSVLTVSSSEFRANMPKVVGLVEKSSKPITVFRNSKPWFEIHPVKQSSEFSPEFQQALDEADAMHLNPNVKTFDTVEALFDDLEI